MPQRTFRARAAQRGEEVVVKLLRPDRMESWKAIELFEREVIPALR